MLNLHSITIEYKMKVNNIQSCHLGPEISPEKFIPEHYFLYLLRGSMKAYDGGKHYNMKPGDYFIARKNHLVRYTKYKDHDEFEKIIITLDESFLKQFLERHPYESVTADTNDSFLFIAENRLIKSFIRSLAPYYKGDLELDETFADIKREELLLILLKSQPDLANIFFNFGIIDKINLEEYMNRNFRFNVSLEKFAYLTGRSLSSFKRDFQKIFGTTPGIWLKKKRLEEAYFKISKQNQRPGDVYLEVGFEDLSHFSFVFKKEFGDSPNEVYKASRKNVKVNSIQND
ncbi:AraC family transcriptional regulator [Chitinophaga sp. OAE865]|uniref:helix-turn-helix domain-containing protein n=1 Tax=Chitinophaga sp. OAE865 TaxID=2817898 RepID=UPI001D7A48B6